MMKAIVLLAIACAFVAAQDVDYRIIGSNMILQRDSNTVRLWGTTSGSSSVTLTIWNNGKQIDQYNGVVQNKNWEIKLKSYPVSGPYDFVVKTGAETKYTNIYFGDVFLCSGQSNMEMSVVQAIDGPKEVADSINYPLLHLFHVQQNDQANPVDNVVGQWLPSSPAALGGAWTSGFSAVCYFFGREIYKMHQGKIPIGLIESNWGGTRVEAWMSPDARKVCNDTASNDPNQASHLWNGMIVPLLKVTIKGAIWYQGESNSGAPDRYACSFPAMIADWRVKFGVGEFPFYFVQLAGWQPGSGFPATRLTQLAALKLPNTGFATAIDIGDPTDIHPIYKQIVGQRLFLNAANMIYGKPVEFRGPTYKTSTVSRSGNRANIVFEFSNSAGGIVPMGTPKCTKCCAANQNTFEVVTTARTQYFAPTNVVISSASSITVSVDLQDNNEQVVAARYAYYSYPECIFHAANSTLPMPPFVVTFK